MLDFRVRFLVTFCAAISSELPQSFQNPFIGDLNMSKLYALTESEVIWSPSYGSDTNSCFVNPKYRVWFCHVLCGYLLRAPTIFSKSLHRGRQHTRALCFNRIWSDLDNIWLIQTDSRVWIFVVSREHCRVLIMIDELGWWWEGSSASKSSSIDPNNKKEQWNECARIARSISKISTFPDRTRIWRFEPIFVSSERFSLFQCVWVP